MYVRMSVCNGFMIEIYEFMHSLRTLPLRMPSRDGGIEIEDEEEEDRRRQNESRCMEDG